MVTDSRRGPASRVTASFFYGDDEEKQFKEAAKHVLALTQKNEQELSK